MEEMGFSIAVPETILMGFAITVVLCVWILWKISKITEKVNDTYHEINDVSDRLKKLEQTLDRFQNRGN